MEWYSILHYLREINSLIEQSDIAYGMIFQTERQMKRHIGTDQFGLERERIWMYITTFLVISGNISKLLFPNPRKKDNPHYQRALNRGSQLRILLEVPENSILKNRVLRNLFEHCDEKLDAYFQSPRKHTLIDKNIGDPTQWKGLEQKEFFRHLDPVNEKLIFLGEKYDLKAMKSDLESLNGRVCPKLKRW